MERLEVSAAVRHIYIYMSLGFKRLIGGQLGGVGNLGAEEILRAEREVRERKIE